MSKCSSPRNSPIIQDKNQEISKVLGGYLKLVYILISTRKSCKTNYTRNEVLWSPPMFKAIVEHNKNLCLFIPQ